MVQSAVARKPSIDGFGNRWYSPIIGKWMSEDPLGLTVDANPYRYVGNGPTNWIDPLGLEEKPAFENVDQVITNLKKAPAAAALLKKFQDAGGQIKPINESFSGAAINFDENTIYLDSKKCASLGDATGGLLYELIRAEHGDEQKKLDKRAIANTISEQEYAEASSKISYPYGKEQHEIASKAVADKVWEPTADFYSAFFAKESLVNSESGWMYNDEKQGHMDTLKAHYRELQKKNKK